MNEFGEMGAIAAGRGDAMSRDAGLDVLASSAFDPLFWPAARLGAPSAWWQHVPFAHWIVSAARPDVLVELGTHTGVSYAAFCQAVQRAGLPTRCTAIDTWRGDQHAGHYDEAVFAEFSRYHDAHFAGFSTLLRSTFDDALGHVENGSIDLLHIDGMHTYEAVRHDFQSWLPKLSGRAVVLFHDVTERTGDFGVWKLWDELRERYPSFTFLHGHGLGVLAVGGDAPEAVCALCRIEDAGLTAAVRARFARLGERDAALAGAQLALQAGAEREREAMRGRERAEQQAALARHEAGAATEAERHSQAETEAARRIAAETETQRLKLQESVAVLQAALGRIEARAREVEQLHDQVINSTAWRMTLPLRRAGRHIPRPLRRGLRGAAKLAWWTATLNLPSRLRERGRRFPLAAAPAEGAQPVVPGVAPAAAPAAASLDALRVVYISGEPDTPGHHYRITLHAAAIAALGGYALSLRLDDIPAHLADIAAATIVVIWRAPWDEQVAAGVAAARRGGARIVLDVDDLMIDPDIARLDIIDGIRSQGLREDQVRTHYARMRQTLQGADLCFTTSEELASHARRERKTVHVLPNGFDQATHDVSRRAAREWRRSRADTLVRIGYAGGTRTHQRDLGLAVPALARLLRENADCRLVLFRTADGTPMIDVDDYPELAGLQDAIEWRSLQPHADLPLELARFDINIAPLEYGNPFCEAKSELKFFEAALVDVPTVASPTGPFRRAIAHGRTGFLAATATDWYVFVRRLAEDSALRRQIARSAYHATLASFGPLRRTAHVARVVDQVLGGVRGATGFALQAQLAGQPRREPTIVPSDIVFTHDTQSHAEVTVVIPLHNYAHHVVEALDSVRAQTLVALDLIIVDDCSTDTSLAVATEWARRHAKRFNRVAVLHHPSNGGLACSRNTGFDAADTAYVLPLDADNVLQPACCEKLLATIRRTGAAFVYPTIQQFGGWAGRMGDLPYDPQHFVGGNYIDAMALVAKEAWAMVGGYHRVRSWEDFDLWSSIAEQGLRGEWHAEVLARYRVHDASMLRTWTSLPANSRWLWAEFTRRHPWAFLHEQHFDRRYPALAPALPAPGAQTRLDRLLPLLRCPVSGERLGYNGDRTALVSADGLHTWTIRHGRAVLAPGADEPTVHPDQHLSNALPEDAIALIRAATGPVLNLSAGGTREPFDHVVEVEYGIFRHTDVVADAHVLPFHDDSFEAVVVMNAFEHYRDPQRVAAELLRVLKPGGRILVHTAFLQPLHERPWHFFNCTRYGAAEWFREFEIERLQVSGNFSPNHSIAWLASEAEAALRTEVSEASADAFAQARLGEFAAMWRDPARRATPLWTDFERLSQAAQEVTAAGFEIFGRKPQAPPRQGDHRVTRR
ncbi:MAG: glycosyltransferase [Xanthobacteraceae bacterium]|nr:glycosyltransferase [Xanthobacteraceae bacterium]